MSDTEPDPQLTQAMAKHFRVRDAGHVIVSTKSSEWELFVGEQASPVPGGKRGVRTLAVNVVEVYEGCRRQGIFKQGMRLLMGRVAVLARTPVLEFQAVRNTRLYLWALRQPHVYVSAHRPESVFLLLGSDWTTDADAPIELRAEADALRALAQKEPAASQNMANRVITVELLEAEMSRRRADPSDMPPLPSSDEQDKEETRKDREERHAAYLSGSLLHAVCQTWLKAWYATQFAAQSQSANAAASV
jgi:hypothetical protein